MRKGTILLLLLSLCAMFSQAQTIDFYQLKGKWDTTKTVQYEAAQYQITYEFKYAKDAKYPNVKRTATTILRVGNQYNLFTDYGLLAFDSISASIARGETTPTASGPKLITALKSMGLKELILQNRKQRTEIIQRKAGGIQRYQYEEPIPELKWELMEGDSIIAGYTCQKAKTHLFGRDYIAWYAPEMELPYGPYKFNGLPGLIFKVQDTQDNFVFTLTGLQKVKGYAPIYIYDNNEVIKSSRKAIRQMYKNTCNDPLKALTGDGTVTVSGDVSATVNAKPYNPIELE